MDNYLVIENDGLIVMEDLFLIGSSTKRNDSSKIGMFGSGWKYSLAYLLRNECKIIIYSGNEEIIIDYKIVLHRDTPIKVITVNGKETSLTTSMGPKWTGWMAIRELVSNAIDEGGFKLNTILSPSNFAPVGENKTVVYVQCNNEMNKCLREYDNYFAFDRVPTAENSIGKIYVNETERDTIVYRKGIRCTKNYRRSYFDFDCNEIDINESRLVNSETTIDAMIRRFVNQGGYSSDVLIAMLKSEYQDFMPNYINESITLLLLEIMKTHQLVTEKMVHYKEYIDIQDNHLIISDRWYDELVQKGHLTSPFVAGAHHNDFMELDTHDFNIPEIRMNLAKFNLDDINIKTGVWNTNSFTQIAYGNSTIFLHVTNLTDDSKMIACKILGGLPTEAFYSRI